MQIKKNMYKHRSTPPPSRGSENTQIRELEMRPTMVIATQLHPIHEANETSPFGGLAKEEFYRKHKVLHSQTIMFNRQNMKIFTQSWEPADAPSDRLHRHRGLVAMVHGYSSESSWVFQLTAVAIAKLGFYVCALDLRGHGYSEGPRGRIPDIEPVVEDCVQFVDSERLGREKLPAFLYGESLGGAVAMLVYLRQKGEWNGLVLNGAMCGISKRYKPQWPLEKLLPVPALIAPNWKIPLTKPLAKKAYSEKWKRDLVSNTPNRPRGGRTPAATALEFMRVVKVIKERCKELDLPMLVLHGEDDVICDVESARRVYELAVSEDKRLEVFAGMGHQLVGETEEGVNAAFGVVFSWLVEKADKISRFPHLKV